MHAEMSRTQIRQKLAQARNLAHESQASVVTSAALQKAKDALCHCCAVHVFVDVDDHTLAREYELAYELADHAFRLATDHVDELEED